ncbi:helix-turn-helix domain-containing protein [uncultured Sphingobacterium sp.]|uniref:helix-turn-helix domain-containing protein n=1 Tax=uncultured Sphingobacterium sp. TaxID=182688 RepID=UPI003747FDF5
MSNVTSQEIIKAVKERRKYLKISQRAMAEQLYISLKAYQNLEIGTTKIDIERLQQIADILQTDMNSLINPPTAQIKGEKSPLTNEKQLLRDKESYISYLEESLQFYRNLIKENNLM